MIPILFALPGNDALAERLAGALPCDPGKLDMHHFPDGESCPRLITPVAGRDVLMLCALDRPDAKLMGLYLAACVARELGARSVGLVVPYLPYMRQDAHFSFGDGVTSAHFARLVSSCCDFLVTVDPHLHRHPSLSAIYTVPTRVVHAAPLIAAWISANVVRPVLVGPDAESAQWVAEVAALAKCPYTILEKKRSGDRAVEVSVPDVASWAGHTPVLVDDIVSTARTMVAAAIQIEAARLPPPVCIAVHALFAGDAYGALHHAGVERIVSCNTVLHSTNEIDVCAPIAKAIVELLNQRGG
ncbi:MAG: ribose-phosphate pyrophosphokinase [Pseudomonadota bacterium]